MQEQVFAQKIAELRENYPKLMSRNALRYARVIFVIFILIMTKIGTTSVVRSLAGLRHPLRLRQRTLHHRGLPELSRIGNSDLRTGILIAWTALLTSCASTVPLGRVGRFAAKSFGSCALLHPEADHRLHAGRRAAAKHHLAGSSALRLHSASRRLVLLECRPLRRHRLALLLLLPQRCRWV